MLSDARRVVLHADAAAIAAAAAGTVRVRSHTQCVALTGCNRISQIQQIIQQVPADESAAAAAAEMGIPPLAVAARHGDQQHGAALLFPAGFVGWVLKGLLPVIDAMLPGRLAAIVAPSGAEPMFAP
eukprot:CAMPEP_0177266096 /NCGR_PEP_ID=MMETSP0367-20130122/62488_1 /TAXON_ID=447022 ORGANISM="Scrippsiella hangoei-like, Strain SHHI-4" /NCGR_SAMPLE_ID=MMETSP0367 /ASSEMBLY_ACC=CAM_ASM_000362 /LENGTH=126 /DNA_ID=CAMNT_0018721415 /DNA_START=38 /DNA_END=421 /DNA_ORIENTATION=-